MVDQASPEGKVPLVRSRVASENGQKPFSAGSAPKLQEAPDPAWENAEPVSFFPITSEQGMKVKVESNSEIGTGKKRETNGANSGGAIQVQGRRETEADQILQGSGWFYQG